MKHADELRNLLRQHTGSEQVFRHSLNANFNYTEGVRAFAQNAGGGAYWLLDILATEPEIKKAVHAEGLCIMLLSVHEHKAVLTVSRDASTDEKGIVTPLDERFRRDIELTDCPEGQWKFYLTWTMVGNREVMLALLPSEY